MILFSIIPLSKIFKNNSTHEKLEKIRDEISQKCDSLNKKINDNEELLKQFNFIDNFNQLIANRNQLFVEKSHSCWFFQNFLNQLQASLKNPDVSDTWFDDLKIQKVFSSKIKSVKNTSKKKLMIITK